MAFLIVAIFLYAWIRQILIAKNKKLDEMAEVDLSQDKEAWEELEKYARLEGISNEEAMENRRNFRFVH